MSEELEGIEVEGEIKEVRPDGVYLQEKGKYYLWFILKECFIEEGIAFKEVQVGDELSFRARRRPGPSKVITKTMLLLVKNGPLL